MRELFNFSNLEKRIRIVKEILSKLQDLSEKADYLNQRTQALALENKALRERILELEGQSSRHLADIQELNKQLEIASIAKEMKQEGDDSGEVLKQKINEYIREIDHCLKLIGD